jgi:HCOMODA/2-hydroxy-3-carboxy-muconic semialdehyde decarboxylase
VRTAGLRPVAAVCAPIGEPIPTWDIRDRFGDTDLLVVTMEQGRDLAATLGSGRVVLMRGHGCVVAGANLRQATMTAIYLQVNARLQTHALLLGAEACYLSPGEIEKAAARQFSPIALERAWEYWCARAGCA